MIRDRIRNHDAMTHDTPDTRTPGAISRRDALKLVTAGTLLGLGVRPPEAEWGLMLNTLRQAIYVNPYLAALPGVMIFITSLSFNLLSDGLRSAMDIRL